MSEEHDIRTANPESTFDWGRRLGTLVEPGLVVGLIGELGAGKTQFVKGVCAGALVPSDEMISSPTFVLIHEYQGRLPIYHFDTYRLPSAAAFAGLGVDEYFEGDGVCLVEWADRFVECLPDEWLEIRFVHRGPTERSLQFSCRGSRWSGLLEKLIAPPTP